MFVNASFHEKKKYTGYLFYACGLGRRWRLLQSQWNCWHVCIQACWIWCWEWLARYSLYLQVKQKRPAHSCSILPLLSSRSQTHPAPLTRWLILNKKRTGYTNRMPSAYQRGVDFTPISLLRWVMTQLFDPALCILFPPKRDVGKCLEHKM